jgi:ATP-dependent helicase Lhr and Lhr-like helicase
VTAPVTGIDRLHPVVIHHIVNSLGWPELRPLQDQAVGPILDGTDAMLLAPTAGGKTEAAVFPLLTGMEQQRWSGLSVVYVCPLKALLNNLLPRLQQYTSWLGRRVAVWHGDITASARQRILREPPDLLLTTPESLEAMLISLRVEHGRIFSGVRAIVVDEVHAFAGDDRGWHLLAVLERLTRVTGRSIQRIGLSATVGNPDELLDWLQGSNRDQRPAIVVTPGVAVVAGEGAPPAAATTADIELDYVGSVDNAATVISALHRGEKRLVFCDSRQLVEEIGAALRERGVTTYLSHTSLSIDETSPGRTGVCGEPRLRHRLHLHPGTRHRRRRSGPGHPGQRPAHSSCVPATHRAHRPPSRQYSLLPVPGTQQGRTAVVDSPAEAMG